MEGPHDPADWFHYHFCPECVGARKAQQKAALMAEIAKRLWPAPKGERDCGVES